MELRIPANWPRLGACGALLLAVAGCSLLSFKSPERPLPPRELNARILTRELSMQFLAAVSRCADDIAATEHDPGVLDNTLRFEIGAVAESRRAATRMAPLMSLLDTWALAVQMQAFTGAGAPGGTLFGAHQQAVRNLSDNYAADAQARRLLSPHDFATYQTFVDRYVREHPLADLTFARPSIVELWSREQGGDARLVDSLGTIPEAMADAADRMAIYGDTLPAQMMHKTELALRESGYTRGEVQAAIRQLDERLALFAELQSERSAVMAQLDVERQAVAEDAARISSRVVKDSGAQLRELAAEVLLLLIVLAVVVLGLPFAAGYLLGRARQGRTPGPAR